MARVSAGLEGLDDDQAPAAAGALLDVLRRNVVVGLRLGCGHGEHVGFGSAGEQPVVPDAMQDWAVRGGGTA